VLASIPVIIIALLLQTPQPSQRPSPAPGESTKTDKDKTPPEQNKATADQKAADEASALLDKAISEIARRDQEQSTRKSKQEAPADWWGRASTVLITIFTGVLAYLAYLQWRAMDQQATHMRDALVETRKTADAAQMSAEVAKNSVELTQRAFIQVVSMGFNRGRIPLADDVPVTDDASVVINIKNHGPTRALNITVKGTLSIDPGNKSTLLAPPISYDLPSATDLGIAFNPFNSWLDADTIALLKQGRANLQATLKITYADIFGVPHEAGIEAVLRDWMYRRWEIKIHST